MKEFMNEDFLLQTETARYFYRKYAKDLPIIDYHCHLPPAEIANDRRFSSITEAWLGGDHYKWRLMRIHGVPERLITGNGGDYEKFVAWAGTLEKLIGNPVYHWTHLELKRYFGIDTPLTVKTAAEIYKKCNEALASPDMSALGMIARSNVEALCTTDDPADDLAFHLAVKEKGLSTKVLPTFRPDRAVDITREDFPAYVSQLSRAAGVPVATLSDLLVALEARADFFYEAGCRLTDMGFEYLPFEKTTLEEASAIFSRALSGAAPTRLEADQYRTFVTLRVIEMIAAHGFTLQLHIGALRNVNPLLFKSLGRDIGCDVIGDARLSTNLASLLGELEGNKSLPKTVLYSLNHKDNVTIAALTGAFTGEGIGGKVQLGSAWWFADHRDGMEEQLRDLANLGMLAHFVGMLTDSRSFLSYPRHEYFRRIFVNLICGWVEEGEYPADEELLSSIIRGVCHDNAAAYFAL